MCAMRARHDLPQPGLSVEDQPTSSGGGALYLPEVTTSIAAMQSLNRRSAGSIKSELQMEIESKARQKEIDCKLLLAEKTSLCFLIDCTWSMTPWIDKVKENIKLWSEQLHARHTNMELNVAFVRYTDYDLPNPITRCDFTTDLDQFHAFVDGILTPLTAGKDTAEDVLGGLNAVLKLSWPVGGTKVLIHITDAPCHGRQFHDTKVSDRYPDGDPGGLKLDDLMKDLVDKEITYYFGYINKSWTLPMIKAFNSSMRAQSNKIHSIQEFDASDPNKLLEGVFRSVTSSITTTLVTLMSGGGRQLCKYTIKDKIPDWHTLPTKVVMTTPPPTIGSGAKLEVPNKPMKLKIAPQPFGEGAQRIVYHAFDEDNKEHIVLKCSKWDDARSNCIKRCLEISQVHAIAANLCAHFNRERPFHVPASEIQFLPVGVMLISNNDKEQYFTYEHYLGSREYKKFNSNFNYVLHEDDDTLSATCQAFSHYTWEKSGKSNIICDLQGIKIDQRVVLTDPAIHNTHVLCHGSTNLGKRGIEQFFHVHKCNDICRAMKLTHPKESIESITTV